MNNLYTLPAGPALALLVAKLHHYSCTHRSSDWLARFVRTVDRLHDPITRTSRQHANTKRLDRSIRRTPLRSDSDPILEVAEGEKDDDRYGDGDEESMGDVLHRKIWYHWDQAAWKDESATDLTFVSNSEGQGPTYQ